MPALERPDGARIQWEATGVGPAVLVCNGFNLQASEGLVEQLAETRRVITFDPRGVGRSSSDGPYDVETGVDDAEAVLEAAGPVDVVFGVGDGAHRALNLADRRPDLADRVVITTTGLGRASGTGRGDGFGGSSEVLSALMSLMRTDYRAGLRSMVGNSGHQDEALVRERVEQMAATIPQEAAVGYLDAWIAASGAYVARRLGRRLTILAYRGNDWFPLSMYESMREELTEACFELLDDGPLNRPDLTAGLLMRLSEPAKA